MTALAVLFFWRGLLQTGAPISGEAAARAAFHPVFGLPAMLLGAADAARLAILLSLLVAGLGMWWLGIVIGMGRSGRIWASLAYAYAGLAGAAFGLGRLGLALGYAWVPWALACALAAVQTRRELYAALAAVALALVLLGGDRGLALASLVVLALFVLVVGLDIRRSQPHASLRRDQALIAGLVLGLGVGLAGIVLLPALFAGSSGGAGGAGGPGLAGVLRELLTEPTKRTAPDGTYAFLGIVPFLFLIGLPLGLDRGDRRGGLFCGLLAALAWAWAAADWLASTGAPAGILVWGIAALLALSGLGLNAAWRWAVVRLRLAAMSVPAAVQWAVARLGVVVLALAAALSLADLYRAGHQVVTGMVAGAPLGAEHLSFGKLAGSYPAASPFAFAVGVIMSSLSTAGVVALLVGDVRKRRSRLETEAIYADGVLRPVAALDIPDGTAVHLTVEAEGVEPAETVAVTAASETLLGTASAAAVATELPAELPAEQPPTVPAVQPLPAARAAAVTATSQVWLPRLAWVFFALGLLVYLATRLWRITVFPIYFFTDEAANPLFAQDLMAHGFRNSQGTLLPLYFELAANRWGPLLSVYIHAISSALAGKSVFVTRATQAIVSVLAPISVALSLKLAFKARFWWMGALLMAAVPAWFLHSRTGFETIIAASFYGCFILFYLLYRTRSPNYLYAAILFGAATFYTYSNGQLIMVAAGVLLALTDIRYHIKNWRTALLGLALIGVLAIPVLRFRATHPGLLEQHLRVLDSYWFHPKPLSEKLTLLVKTWAYGMSPAYWFVPNQADLVRHQMLGYGNIPVWLLPFFLLGVGVSLWRTVKGSVPHRVLLLVAIAAPAGGALAQVALTRVMAFVVPAMLLTAVGIEALLDPARRRVSEWVLAPALFVVLTVPTLLMTRDAVVNGPLWFRDYELYGMQYGATQLFGDAIPQYLNEHPDTIMVVSPTWANGTDSFVRFFLPPEQQSRVQMLNVDYFMIDRRPLSPNMVLVMTQNEYDRAKASGKFKSIDVERTIPYPDGRTGFYLARLAYADNLDEIIAREREERSRPVQEEVTVDGQTVQLLHSKLDIGVPSSLFDGDTFTLVRGLEANPLVFEFTFPKPWKINGLSADFGAMDFTLTAGLYADENGEPKVYSETYRGLPGDPHVDMTFAGAPEAVKKLRLEVLQLNAPTEPHIHVRELKFQE